MAGTFGSPELRKNIADMVERSQMTPDQRAAEDWLRDAPSWFPEALRADQHAIEGDPGAVSAGPYTIDGVRVFL